ncbi:MAG: YjzC family protein [Candidatus Acidiferrales bacterium]
MFQFEFRLSEEFMGTFKPGETAPDSGELVEVGPRGGKVANGRRTVIERGETVPPTSGKGNQFKYKRGSQTTRPKK